MKNPPLLYTYVQVQVEDTGDATVSAATREASILLDEVNAQFFS